MLFNSSERKGIFILLFLIIAIIVIPQRILPEKPDFFLLPAEIRGDSIVSPSIQYPLKTQKFTPIELNTADSCTLVKLRGIGPFYASKIIRYRQQLGGFYSVNQLKELKLTYFNVDSNAHLFTVDSSLIRPMDMDTMSFKAILRHPYLKYEDVQLIFNAKRKYGHVSYSILEEHNVLTKFKLKKLKPYFK